MTDTADQLFSIKKYERAIRMLRKSISYYDKLYGKKNEYFDYITGVLNSRALRLLETEEMKYSFFILKNLEKFIRERKNCYSVSCLVETFNNLSFWYKKAGQFKSSLEYIQKAQQLIFSNGLEAGLTDLNKCAIYSAMGK